MNNELYHHGILGMKWGVRRYQPYGEGGYTPKTKRAERKEAKKSKREDSKNRHILSDEELKNKINRLQMEKQLKDLTDKEVNEGRGFIKEVIKNSGSRILGTVITGATLYGIKSALGKDFNPKDFGNAMFNGGPKKK